jgi:hypothetical protein
LNIRSYFVFDTYLVVQDCFARFRFPRHLLVLFYQHHQRVFLILNDFYDSDIQTNQHTSHEKRFCNLLKKY